MEEMNITISSPGGPGTSLIESVKKSVLLLFRELEKCDNFDSLKSFKTHMTSFGMNEDYLRNILPYIQNLGLVEYNRLNPFINADFFTNLGNAYVDVLSSIEIINAEPDSDIKTSVLEYLESIEQVILFQCMKKMMMSKECKYAIDFYDVLRFVNEYESIDLTEYYLLIYERSIGEEGYLEKMRPLIKKYRQGQLNIHVSAEIKKNIKKTNNKKGAAKRINTFPYVKGNFVEAGILKTSDSNRFIVNEARKEEIDSAIKEIEENARL